MPARPAAAAGAAAGAAGTRRRRRRRGARRTRRPPPRRAGAAADDARVPGGLLHRPHGSAVLAHRRRAARLSVLGAERPADEPVRRHRLDLPGGLRRAGGPRHRREGARRRRWSRSTGEVTAAERRARARATVFAINHNADNALITLRYKLKDADIQIAEEPFEAGGAEVRPRLVRHQEACRRPISTRRRRSSASRRMALAAGAVGEDASGPRRAGRDPAHLDQHADRRLVAAGVRHLRDSLRLHRAAGRSRRHAEPAREVRRHHLRARRQPGGWSRACRCGGTRCRGRTRPRRRTSAPGRRPTTCGLGMG